MNARAADAPVATIEPPMRLGDQWLVAVALTRAVSHGARSAYLSKTPTAVVMLGSDGARAFRIGGAACDVAQLLAEVPELEDVMAALAAGDWPSPKRDTRSASPTGPPRQRR